MGNEMSTPPPSPPLSLPTPPPPPLPPPAATQQRDTRSSEFENRREQEKQLYRQTSKPPGEHKPPPPVIVLPPPSLPIPPPPPFPPLAATQQRDTRSSEFENKREQEKQLYLQTSKPPGEHKPLSLPKHLRDILKDAAWIDKSSMDKLYDQLYSSGVFLAHNTKKFWVNKKLNCNCFMLYARALSITWGDDPRYWTWQPLQESSGAVIEVAELRKVCWLEVNGRLDTRKLTPGVLYEVSFHVMLKDPAQGWEAPVNARIVLPGGKKQEHKVTLIDKLRVRWIEIPIGKFVAPAHEDGGEMEFSLYEYEYGAWKLGLLICGVSIKPNSNDYRISLW